MSQLGWFFPIYGKIRNVPNHQPDKHWHAGDLPIPFSSQTFRCKLRRDGGGPSLNLVLPVSTNCQLTLKTYHGKTNTYVPRCNFHIRIGLGRHDSLKMTRPTRYHLLPTWLGPHPWIHGETLELALDSPFIIDKKIDDMLDGPILHKFIDFPFIVGYCWLSTNGPLVKPQV